MSPEVQKIIYEAAIKAGDELNGKLPPHRFHPKGRNSYAHVSICIKKKFNASYKDINDEKFEEVLSYIEF